MEYASDIDAAPATRAAASPALWPAVFVLAGTCAAPHLGYLPLAAVTALIGLGLALRGPGGWAVVALGAGLLNAAVQPGEPATAPRRPVAVVATVAGHPVRHDDSTFFIARVRHWRVAERVRRAGFDLQVTIPPGAAPPAIGSIVRLRGYLRRSPGYANGMAAKPGPWRLCLPSGAAISTS